MRSKMGSFSGRRSTLRWSYSVHCSGNKFSSCLRWGGRRSPGGFGALPLPGRSAPGFLPHTPCNPDGRADPSSGRRDTPRREGALRCRGWLWQTTGLRCACRCLHFQGEDCHCHIPGRLRCLLCFHRRSMGGSGPSSNAYSRGDQTMVFVFPVIDRSRRICPLALQMDTAVQQYDGSGLSVHQSV